MKKAQNISINVIIVAAIALIVLVVLVAVFTGQFGMFTGGVSKLGNPTKACDSGEQGMPVFDADGQCPEGARVIAAKVPAGKVCCSNE